MVKPAMPAPTMHTSVCRPVPRGGQVGMGVDIHRERLALDPLSMSIGGSFCRELRVVENVRVTWAGVVAS
ncbi:MAG: hypothetical protein AMXMBFR67_27590 [Nitrospira sp.]